MESRDAIHVMATFLMIILSSLMFLAGSALLIGVFVVGFLMIFDHNYLGFFDQWLVAAILFIVYRVATLTYRSKTDPAVMVVMVSVYDNLDGDREFEYGAGSTAAMPADLWTSLTKPPNTKMIAAFPRERSDQSSP